MKFPGKMNKGYGCVIELVNTKTGQAYVSKTRGPFGDIAYIANIPNGEYRVTKLRIPTGMLEFRLSLGDTSTLCPRINIAGPKVYFLGSYVGRTSVHAIGQEMYLDLVNDDAIDRIAKQTKKAKWDALPVEDSQKLFQDASIRL